MTSNVNDLSARLRRRMEDEDRETTAIAERELRTFGETLSASANDKLRITEAAMEAEVGRIQGLLWRSWLRSLVVGLFVFPGIFAGSWGLTQWQSTRVERLVERQEALRLAVAQEQQALEQLQAQTWGVWLHEGEDATRYVVMPRSKVFPEDWLWTVQGQRGIPGRLHGRENTSGTEPRSMTEEDRSVDGVLVRTPAGRLAQRAPPVRPARRSDRSPADCGQHRRPGRDAAL